MYLAPPSPSLVAPDGTARFGARPNALGPVEFDGLCKSSLRGRLWHAAHHKRWLFAFGASQRHVVTVAVVHLGYVGTTFICVLDKAARAMLFDHQSVTLPQLITVGSRCEEGCDVQFRGAGTRVAITRPQACSSYLLVADTPRATLRVTFETGEAPAPFASVSPVHSGFVSATAKRVLMPARGTICVDDQLERFDEGIGGLDYTNGLLARQSQASWAFGMGKATDGRSVAFSLVDGRNNGGLECALWLDGELVLTESAKLAFDPRRPLGPWSVRTADDRAQLSFRGDAMHQQGTRLGLLRASFIQPMGMFSGRLNVPRQPMATIVDVCGVVQNHNVTW